MSLNPFKKYLSNETDGIKAENAEEGSDVDFSEQESEAYNTESVNH